jgi:hypothetical protein
MTPKQFLSQLRHLISMLASFPQGPPAIFTEDELKRIFLYAHPVSWVDHFENAGVTASSQDMNKIKRYIEQQVAKEALPTQCQAKGQGNSNGNGGSNNSSRRNRGRGNNNNSNNSNNNRNQGHTGGRGGNQSTNSNFWCQPTSKNASKQGILAH